MAQSTYTPIQLYRSGTASAAPSAGNLALGELALNYNDEKLYFKNASGVVKQIAGSGSLGTVTSVNASGGTTGLSFSGGPITSSGTLTLGGTLSVANGGTGQTSLTAGYVLKGGGTSAIASGIIYDDGVKVGIGTASPSEKLHIATGAPSAFVRMEGSVGNLYVGVNTSGEGEVSTSTNSPLVFKTFGSERARIDSSGNVGIGTTSPGSRLDVVGGDIRIANNRSISFRNAAGTGTSSFVHQSDDTFVVYNVAGAPIWSFTPTATPIVNYGADSNLRITLNAATQVTTFVSGGSERMRIDASGDVSIGSTGGDYGRTWRLLARDTANRDVYAGVVNGSTGASATATFTKITGTGNSFADWKLIDAAGAPYDLFSYGSAVLYTAWSFSGNVRFRLNADGSIVSENLANAVGYKGIPQRAITASTSLTLADMSYDIYISGTTAAQSVTIPANASVAFPVGTVIKISNDSNQNWTIPITSDTLVWTPTGATGTRTLAPYGEAKLEKKTPTRWWISGSGLS